MSDIIQQWSEEADEEIVTISVLCLGLNQLGQASGPGNKEKVFNLPALPEGEITEVAIYFTDTPQGGNADLGGTEQVLLDPLEGTSLDVSDSATTVNGTIESTATDGIAEMCLKNDTQEWCWKTDGSDSDRLNLVDVTNGDTKVVSFQPGAPTQSLFVNVTGDIGFGSSPTYRIDVSSSAAADVMNRTSAAADVSYGLQNTASEFRWLLDSIGDLYLSDETAGTKPIRVWPALTNNVVVLRNDGVGINTTTVNTRLDVVESTAAVAIARFINTNTTQSKVEFEDTGTATRPYIGSVGDAMRVDATAFGLNKTPTQDFHIYQSAQNVGIFAEATSTFTADLFLKNVNGSFSFGVASTGAFTMNDLLWTKIPYVVEPNTPNFAFVAKATTGYVGIGTYFPENTLHVTGSVGATSVAKTTNYTAAEEHTINCDASSGAITITLPAASTAQDRIYNIKKTDSSANVVTIDGNGSETIDGATTQTLVAQYECLTIQCDGSNWGVL